MHHHAIFGGTLAAELPFPELEPVEGLPSWTLRVHDAAPGAARSRTALGEERLVDGVTVRMAREDDTLVVEYDDTGRFEIRDAGQSIVWRRRAGVPDEAVRTDVISRVMAAALHAGGRLCLHGSAVAIDGRAVLFLAPKLHGKSTLAVALARAGARLLSDDAVPVAPAEGDRPAMAWPGVHSVRLWGDSAARLGAVPSDDARKHLLLHPLPAERLAREPVPIAAIYLLAPVAGTTAEAVARTAVPPTLAAMHVLRHAKLGALLGGAEGAAAFGHATALAAAVPVHVLHVARDFDRLPQVVTTVLGWHGTAAGVA